MSRPAMIVSSSLWLCAVMAGIAVMIGFSSAPGSTGESPSAWPQDTGVGREANATTLVMLAHPRCPCTRASIDSLAWIITRERGRLAARVLFYEPESRSPDWVETPNWNAAGEIAGVVRIRDRDGVEAKRFGMVTSGDVRLFDRDGKLLFSGGITPGRGMLGDNEGRRAIVALVAKGQSDVARTRVFGCPIVNPSEGIGNE